MPYHQLTPEQIAIAAAQWDRRLIWQEFQDFVDAYYGPSAHHINVKIEGCIDDEGNGFNTLEDLDVFDAHNNVLLPDPLLPASQKLLHEAGKSDELPDPEELLEHLQDRILDERSQLPIQHLSTTDDEAWSRDKLPELTYSALFAFIPEPTLHIKT